MAAHHHSGDKQSVLRAWYLLWVSTQRQMRTATDIDPEGNSIPAQRKHCDIKGKELRAIKIGETIEPGKSGQSWEKRPEFKELIQRITEQRDVDYVIIYMGSRIFRNYKEAVAVTATLESLGVKVISARENFGDDEYGEAMAAITDIFNWLEVCRNGKDIAAKMLNKAQNGGTVGRAKLGYRNTTVKIEGHDVNTIEVDANRSPYVVIAFELAATGTFSSIDSIRAKITAAGLRMPRGKPVSIQQMYKILRERRVRGAFLCHRATLLAPHRRRRDAPPRRLCHLADRITGAMLAAGNDNRTEIAPRPRAKIRTYRDHFTSGGISPDGVPPRVLVTAPDPQRAEMITELLSDTDTTITAVTQERAAQFTITELTTT